VSTDQGRVLVERRRSNAAGLHGKTKHSRKDRANTRRREVERSIRESR